MTLYGIQLALNLAWQVGHALGEDWLQNGEKGVPPAWVV